LAPGDFDGCVGFVDAIGRDGDELDRPDDDPLDGDVLCGWLVGALDCWTGTGVDTGVAGVLTGAEADTVGAAGAVVLWVRVRPELARW
jgi:hypothetical protein